MAMSVDYYKIDRNIGSKFMESDSKAWACFTIPLRTLLTRVYKWKQSRRNFSLNNIISIARKRHDKIASYASCAFMEIWSAWAIWRALITPDLPVATPRAVILQHLAWSPNFAWLSTWSAHTVNLVHWWIKLKPSALDFNYVHTRRKEIPLTEKWNFMKHK